VPRCAQCKKEIVREGNRWFPFCSERCKLVDLGQWIGEQYRIPAENQSEVGSEPTPPDDDGKKTVH